MKPVVSWENYPLNFFYKYLRLNEGDGLVFVLIKSWGSLDFFK